MGNSNTPPPPPSEDDITVSEATTVSPGVANKNSTETNATGMEKKLVLNPHTGKMEENTGGCPFAKAAAAAAAHPPAVTKPPPVVTEDTEENLVVNPHTGKKDAHEGGCPYGGAPHAPPHPHNHHSHPQVKQHSHCETATDVGGEQPEKCPFAATPGSKADLLPKAEREKEECPFKPVPGSRADVAANADKEECPFKPVSGSRADKESNNEESSGAGAEVIGGVAPPSASLSSEEIAKHEHDMSQIPLEEWGHYCETTDRSEFFRFAGPAMSVEEFQAVALRKIHFDNADKTSSKSIILTYNGLEKLQVDCVVNAIDDEKVRVSAGHCYLHAAAGPQLQASCAELSMGCSNGEEVVEPFVSKSYNLPSTFVFHVHVPAFKVGAVEEHNASLSVLYWQCFEKADSMGLKTIALPCLGCGGKDYPTETHPLMIQRLALKFLRNSAKTLQNVVFSFTDEEMAFLYQMNFTSLMELTWFPEDL